MADKLENLVRQAETDITSQNVARPAKSRNNGHIPRVSVAIGIWLVVIILGALQFDEVVSMFSKPAESSIERDLGGILISAADSLRRYEVTSGVLPPILPNPAIRGLVKYDLQSDVNYQLTATISNVTMVMGSASTSPHRAVRED